MKLVVPSNVFVRALKAVVMSASTDGTRAHLNSVWLRVIDGQVPHLWATNGHWLSCCRLDGCDRDQMKEGFIGTSVDDVRKLLAVAPQRPTGLTISNDGKTTTFDFGFASTTVKAIDATPPPVHSIVPNRLSTKKHKRAAISNEILTPVLRAFAVLAKGRKRALGLRFYAMGETELDPQIVWSSECPEYFALCMPFRTGGKRREAMQWWHDASKSIEDAIVAAQKAAPVEAAAE